MSFDVNEEVPYNPHSVGSPLWEVRERARLPKKTRGEEHSSLGSWLFWGAWAIALLLFCLFNKSKEQPYLDDDAPSEAPGFYD